MLRVVTALPTQRSAALSLLFQRDPDVERAQRVDQALAAQEAGELDFSHLLVAERDGTLVGAGLMVLQEDGCAFVWPPMTASDPARIVNSASAPGTDDAEIARALFAELHRRIDASAAWIAQAMFRLDETDDRARMAQHGFRHLTDLIFMERSLSEPLPVSPSVELACEFYSPETNHDRFVAIIERTYSGTRDCPELNGTRTGAEALASHRLTGEFDPSRWMIFKLDGQDAGVLLMASHAAQQSWEVVYMGVAPEARGQQAGRRMLLRGLRAAQRGNARAVLLAVDARNHYARMLYDDLGFTEVAIRAVHARFGR